ncbi:hypothetical protein HY025_01655 [Candidatus Daviesbacteria bacterium]|nr:hypothetical protein [Candidatus Daviesbacteria bacterium]
MNKGKFIVIYGANNLGKTTQAKILVDVLKEKGYAAAYVKYPIYDLAPTGPKLNAILRGGEKLPSELELQKIFVQNRFDFQPKLLEMLNQGTWVVAEDYKGTGMAWGMVRNLKIEDLEKMNEGLVDEDLAILLFGERFKNSVEKNHINEENEQVWQKGQEKHLKLAEKFNWLKISANASKIAVHQKIWEAVKNKFDL